MKKEIFDEIKNIAPDLAEIGNQNPFKVPDAYFENMQVPMIPSAQADELPDNYFENLSTDILSKMHKEESVEKSPAKIISINRNKWAIAASVILLSVASYFTMNSANTIENNDSFALDVELEEAFEYFTEYDDIFISEVEELGQIELFNDIDDDYLDEDIDYLLDDITLEDLEELL